MFTFCPLQGALSESTASQSLLELDGGVKVLINVGWDETFDVEKLRELEKQVSTISLILLTHATVAHLGAYAHCCKHFPLFARIPVYATRPVIDLGRTLTQDLYSSTPVAATTIPAASLADVSYTQASSAEHPFLLQAPTPEETARYFSLIQPLKYSQPHQPLPSPFSPPLNGLTITAYNSGHTLGGTIWHIQHGLESIAYAVDWNQVRENVFSGAAWLGSHNGVGGTEVIEQLRKPTALICSSRTPEASLARARRDEQILESIKLCIARGGTVLIPVDSSARVLELAYLMEHAFRNEIAKDNEVFKSTKLYLAGRSVGSTMRNARSMLEWMDPNIVREFEAVADVSRKPNNSGSGGAGKEAGPFDFKYLRLIERKAQVERILQQAADDDQPRGRIILASDASLDWGFSKDVLRAIAADARNLVILTEKPSVGTANKRSVARTLWDWWKERKDGVATEQTSSGDSFEQVYTGGQELELTDATRQALEGSELMVYQQWLATQRQLQATLQTGGATALEASADAVDDVSSESSSDSEGSETEQQGKALNISTTLGQASRKKVVLDDKDLGVNILIKKKGVYDFDVRGKKGRDRMFPVPIRRKRHDEFGELIRPEEYLRAEEREDVDGAEPGQFGNNQEDRLGKKRRFDDVGAAGKGGFGANKRPQIQRALSAEEPDFLTHANGPGGDELDELQDEEETVVGPAKLILTSQKITVRLRIAFVDFSGLHDKRSLNMLIPLIQPRKLIFVSGSEEETLALAADCKKLLSAKLGTSDEQALDVLAPAVGETADASMDTNAWVVRLADPLVKRLKWQSVHGLDVVTVTGLLLPGGAFAVTNADQEDGTNKRLKIEGAPTSAPTDSAVVPLSSASGDGTSLVPTLDVLPHNRASAVRSAAQPLHVGDLRLADLRRAMLNGGHKAEFRGEGTLVIDDAVAVRKTVTGRIEIESVGLPQAMDMGGMMGMGAGGGTFYAVRKKIYEGLAVVAGA
ncbi:beta-lactamase-like protein [Immersiella caudata]|uniref:Cleavage and polyadenylation specificity factor subunit 2 n=1 Tax=Immersiella caudata TaxID=314043 RepID=A0AA39WC18_9PEZI|nr:beta-lactamase-like protein [Immersiella caudata]